MPSIKKLRLFQLAAVIFLTVSGGPYGLEPLLTYAGPNGSLLLLLITPILWDIPAILAVLEMNSMMPVTGGYYQWVKRALGLRFALYEGWWTWLYTFVDLAIYPVLFVEYASFLFPEIHQYKIYICLFMIWGCAILNIIGIVPVGKTAVVLGVLVLTPFVILFGMAFYHHTGTYAVPGFSLKGVGFSSIGMGLYTVMWNFLGWDNATTYAEEVENPVRSYLYAVGIAFIAVMLIYSLTIFTALQSGMKLETIVEENFASLGSFIGGKWLGTIIAFGGLASTFGIYSSVLLSVSRVPKVMADDGFIPHHLNKLHVKFDTPYVSIITCSVVVSIMVLFTFGELIVMDVTLYGAGLLLEFISLIVLRMKFPDEHRPFKIPLNVFGLCLMMLLPLSVYSVAMAGAFASSETIYIPLIGVLVIMVLAEGLWQLYRWRNRQDRMV
ncbi:APC family permease [Mucilaginibacter sp. HMF5004]|uniref:APC family permease n=1 Tax=Mucilaginibacter rivuli TaxID=2857527 RepID=UPI001C600CF2|nr:APC family permease [Mucilaginibacter rivuli]MBW4891211.1 APC family permease [Mucilaginibacter rivuli]